MVRLVLIENVRSCWRAYFLPGLENLNHPLPQYYLVRAVSDVGSSVSARLVDFIAAGWSLFIQLEILQAAAFFPFQMTSPLLPSIFVVQSWYGLVIWRLQTLWRSLGQNPSNSLTQYAQRLIWRYLRGTMWGRGWKFCLVSTNANQCVGNLDRMQ